MPTKEQIPVAPGLFTWPSDEPRLIGSRCADCGVMTFPAQRDCPGCTGDRMQEALFDRRGTLWTFTTQGFVPKSPPYSIEEDPDTFVPYAVGYVEFAGQARVEGRILENDPAKLVIGMEMEVVVVPFREDDDGNQVMTYAFRPVA
jgi:uncharacterized OB-fold protein